MISSILVGLTTNFVVRPITSDFSEDIFSAYINDITVITHPHYFLTLIRPVTYIVIFQSISRAMLLGNTTSSHSQPKVMDLLS